MEYLAGPTPNSGKDIGNREDSNKGRARAHRGIGTDAQGTVQENVREEHTMKTKVLQGMEKTEEHTRAVKALEGIEGQLGAIGAVGQMIMPTDDQASGSSFVSNNKHGSMVTQSDSSNHNTHNSVYSACTDANFGLGPGYANRALEEEFKNSTLQARPREQMHEMGNFVYVANKNKNEGKEKQKKGKYLYL